MRILLTRPLQQAIETKCRLEKLGHAVHLDPMLTIRATGTPLPHGLFAAVVVTSRNAVEALQHVPDWRLLIDLPLFTIGNRTAEVAQELGFSKLEKTGGDARALVERIVAVFPAPRHFLYLAGHDRSFNLSAALSRYGHSIAMHETYEATMTEHFAPATQAALENHNIDVVMHYSRRTAEAFVACAQKAFGAKREILAKPRHLCLSERIASPLRRANLSCILIAEKPEQSALFSLLGNPAFSLSAQIENGL